MWTGQGSPDTRGLACDAGGRRGARVARSSCACPRVDRQSIGDGYLMRTGLFDNSRNVIVLSRMPSTVEEVIDRLAGVPARWHTGDMSDSPSLRLALERAGCRPDQSSVHMAAALRDMAITPSDAVSEVHAADDFAHVDVGEARLLASAGSPLRHFVIGRSAGITTFTAGCAVLGVHLWVERSSRRRGMARTLVRHAAAVARAEGCTHAVLSPTPATISFYQRMGFVLERSMPDRWYFLP